MRSKLVTIFMKAFEIYGNNEADSKGLIKSLIEK